MENNYNLNNTYEINQRQYEEELIDTPKSRNNKRKRNEGSSSKSLTAIDYSDIDSSEVASISKKNLNSFDINKNKNNVIASLFIILETILVSSCFFYQRLVFKDYPNLTYGKTNLTIGIYLTISTAYLALQSNLSFSYDVRNNRLLFWRVMTSFSSESCIFIACKFARISSISCISLMYPLISCLLIGYFLNHHVSKKDYVYLVCCFLGSVLIVKPMTGSGEDSFLGIFIAFCSTTVFSFTILVNKLIARTTHCHIVNFYTGLAFFFFGLFLCLFVEENFSFSIEEILVLSCVGIAYSGVRFCFNYALVTGELHYILPFDNLSTVFSSLLGHFLLGDSFDFLDAIGISIVLSICILKSLE